MPCCAVVQLAGQDVFLAMAMCIGPGPIRNVVWKVSGSNMLTYA